MLWLYTAVIRPMIAYAIFICSNVTTQTTKINKLGKIQRQACLAISSGRQSVASSVLNVTLNIPPLKLYLQAKAIKTYHRLMNTPENYPTNKITINNITKPLEKGHLGIIKKLSNTFQTLEMPSDQSLPTVNKPQFYQVNENQATQNPCPRLIHCYTDGSRGDAGSGAGVFIYYPDLTTESIEIPLGKYATVFQSEIIGIYTAAKKLLPHINNEIIIHSDSQASLKALKKSTITSKTVEICSKTLNLLGENNTVSLEWVKPHCGIHGNEMADKIAKKAANTPFIGPEPVLPIATCILKSEIEKWLIREHSLYWQLYTGGIHAKKIFPTPNPKVSKLLLEMNRDKLRSTIAYISGHCSLNRFENICKRVISPLCRKCNKEMETPIHILKTCEALFIQRYNFFGFTQLPNNLITQLNPYKILKFFIKVNINLTSIPET
jgi:ribonuclease HI